MEFKDIIKIVYAWYGPGGPLWNTELPNILNFSRVAENTKINSRNFWCDDLWHKLFRFKKEGYILYPVSEITEDDIFIYPFSLSWRIQFNTYFYGNTGILEFSHTNGHIIHMVRNHKGFFLIDLAVEAFVQEDQLAALHNYFNRVNGIPMNKVIYLTGCMNANELYQEFKQRRGLPNRPDQNLNIISYPSSQAVYATQLKEGQLTEPDYNTEQVPEKLFLCWNRRFRPHRTELALALDKEGLVDRSYYSMSRIEPENPDVDFKSTVDLFNNPELGLTKEDADKFVNKLPLKIDEEKDCVQMCADWDMRARNFYQNSLVSIVTETNYNFPEVTLTEKSFKPAKEKHPFILVGSKGSLASMRSLGYKTFSEFWDESYDDIKDHRERMRAIIKLCKEIASWDNNKIIDFKRRVKPILDHNFNLLRRTPSDYVSEEISRIVRSNI